MKVHSRVVRRAIFTSLIALCLCPLPLREGWGRVFISCVPEREQAYAPFAAFFQYSPVTSAPSTLLPALNGPSEWCTVTLANNGYTFGSTTTGKTDHGTRTAADNYRPLQWVAGLIVGIPASPDMNGQMLPVAFDLACPSCYEEDGIKRGVSVSNATLGRFTCTRCHRIYSLPDGGIVIDGAQSKDDPRLYRYRHCDYNNNTLVVSN